MSNTILYSMKSIASLLTFLLLLSTPLSANEGQKGYCQNAETTADIVECISARHKIEQDRLKTLYDLIDSQTENQDDFRKNQTNWIQYRDETCTIEANIYTGGSLERVQELDCHVRLTANRIKHFNIIADAMDTSQIPEFTNPPRWVNALVRDYPNVFWGFGSAQTLDTDCDGINENIVRGLDDEHSMVLALAKSDQTGRPKITIINFSDDNNCQILPDIVIETLPEPKPIDNAPLTCVQRLMVKTKSCGEFAVQYNSTDKSYNIIK